VKTVQTLSVISHKGGTGKTTITMNLGAALNNAGKSVLIVDFDAQANLSEAFGHKNVSPGIGDLMLGKSSFAETVINIKDNFDLLPASTALAVQEHDIYKDIEKPDLLRYALKNQNYDYCLIDCSPTVSDMNLIALIASQAYLVPIQGDNFSMKGVSKVQESAKLVERKNPDLMFLGVLKNRFDQRTKFGQMVDAVLEESGIQVFNTAIRQDINLMECTYFGKSIFDYSAESRGADDFKELATELLTHI
jgi:chromosome partitioning protein